jgi:hypothetical protein
MGQDPTPLLTINGDFGVLLRNRHTTAPRDYAQNDLI